MRRFLRSACIALPLLAASAGGRLQAAPTQPSVVRVTGSQLIVERRLPDETLAAPRPYVIKGINWSPGTYAPQFGPDPKRGGASVPYGFFFDGDWRLPGMQGHELMNYWLKQEMQSRYAADAAVMAQMNVNTVRAYLDFGTDPAVYKQILDGFYDKGIMVILTVVATKDDIDSGRYLQTVSLCKNHPAILMWSIGNEWNLSEPPLFGYPSFGSAIAGVNQAAGAIKAADANHPVTSSLGDKFTLRPPGRCGGDSPLSDVPAIVSRIPNVDLWGLNVFRGASFLNLFTQWAAMTPKPFYLSEYGTDSFHTTSFTLPFNSPPCNLDNRGLVTAGAENQAVQAAHFTGLWNEIATHLSAVNPAENCVGGVVFEFNDAVWKVGNFHLRLGQLVSYDGPDGIPGTPDDDASYGAYNREGFEVVNGHPDNFANEEYFGVVTADRQPKLAFAALKTAFAGAPDVKLTKTVDKTVAASGEIVTYSIQYRNTGLGDARNFTLRDVLPPDAVLVPGSITSGGTFTAGTIQWIIGTVPAFGSGVVSFQVKVP